MGAFALTLTDSGAESPHRPLNSLRTIHSINPCLAWSAHVTSPGGRSLSRVKVR
jgi:hydrogenase large subunit